MRSLNVLMKVSEQCPLKCIYCYEGNKGSSLMSKETLENSIMKFEGREDVDYTKYIWHGAEPLAAGIDFYKSVRKLQAPYEKENTIRNGMQSSGVLLDSEFADFIAQENIGFGVSLDGPEHIHNMQRPYRSGVGSFKQVMNAINLMRERRRTPGCIAVITKKNIQFIDEIYDFFKDEGLNVKIHPAFNCGYAADSEISLNEDEIVHVNTYLFDKLIDEKETNNPIINLKETAESIFSKGTFSCVSSKNCQKNFISVGVEGTVYPCSRFSGNEVCYGNINSDSLESLMKSPIRQKLLRRFEENSSCVKCKFKFLCYSGCPHNAHVSGNISSKDPFCRSNIRVFNHISKRILEKLKKDGAITKS